MTAKILDGKLRSDVIRQDIASEVKSYLDSGKRPPKLVVILVGDDPASHVYVRSKEVACQAVGMTTETYRLPASTSEATLLELITKLNLDRSIDGILPQLPLPPHIDRSHIVAAINSNKDVDGLGFYNQGRLTWNLRGLRPCTPSGIMDLIQVSGIKMQGSNAVVIGRSILVGLPTALMLMHEGATVTCIHSKTLLPEVIAARADILVAAAGVPHLVKRDWIKPGAVVIDVGIHRNHDNKLIGDVDDVSAAELASYRSPVPGGVGPMTIAMLLRNTLQAYQDNLDGKKG